MAEYVTLMGAEDVRSAGRSMQQAADDMSSAARSLSETLWQHRQFMDDWLMRLEQVLTDALPKPTA